ncbi:hypothetical protein QY884_11155 [Latilactobacillus sakei]
MWNKFREYLRPRVWLKKELPYVTRQVMIDDQPFYLARASQSDIPAVD